VPLKIGYSVDFKKAKLPSKKKLIGKHSILEPINTNKHLKDLFVLIGSKIECFPINFFLLGSFAFLKSTE
jgi:hypothetical protein